MGRMATSKSARWPAPCFQTLVLAELLHLLEPRADSVSHPLLNRALQLGARHKIESSTPEKDEWSG